MSGPERRDFVLAGRTYQGFLNVLDVGSLEKMVEAKTSADLLQRCLSIHGAFAIISLAARNVAKNTDGKALQRDFDAEVRKNGLTSVSEIAAELIQDTGLVQVQEQDEKKA